MNRLWVRLTLAFILITLLGVGSVVLLVDWTAGNEFRRYAMQENLVAPGGLVDQLETYYQTNGSWQGAEGLLNSAMPGGRGRGAMNGAGMGRRGMVLTLADANGKIIYDETGTRTNGQLSGTERANAIPLQSGNKTVGFLLALAPEGSAMLPAQQAFIDQLRNTLLLAGLGAGILGILLGLVISRTLAAPLAALAAGARSVASHHLDKRVPVKGADEIAAVARAFNEMADELETSDQARRNMIADIAHELRTPLTVMQGNLRALLDEVYPLERSEIATLYDETRLLARLVDDLRELALADAGQLSLNLSDVEVAPLLQTAINQFSIPADEQGIRLASSSDGHLPRVRADQDRLAQVLRNLISNALRHTPGGGEIKVRAEPLTGASAMVRISVSDTGEGIAAKDLPRVFERFYRADKARSRGAGNTGLGLAIAKAWVEAMGGQIGVESKIGQGSCFWVTLPRSD